MAFTGIKPPPLKVWGQSNKPGGQPAPNQTRVAPRPLSPGGWSNFHEVHPQDVAHLSKTLSSEERNRRMSNTLPQHYPASKVPEYKKALGLDVKKPPIVGDGSHAINEHLAARDKERAANPEQKKVDPPKEITTAREEEVERTSTHIANYQRHKEMGDRARKRGDHITAHARYTEAHEHVTKALASQPTHPSLNFAARDMKGMIEETKPQADAQAKRKEDAKADTANLERIKAKTGSPAETMKQWARAKKKPTFKEAKEGHLNALKEKGWTVQRTASTGQILKTPHATSPDGKRRLYFKSQAVYESRNDNPRGKADHDMKGAHSLTDDMRDRGAGEWDESKHPRDDHGKFS